jgi:hypothetical protein
VGDLLFVIPVCLICLIGGLLAAVGGLFATGVLLTVRQGLRTRSWPVAFGRVVEKTSSMDESPVESEAVLLVPDDAPPAAQRLVYEYEVDGKRFTSSNVQLQGNVRSTVTDRIESELGSRFRVGESVLVFYNPAKPEEAVLEAGIPGGLIPVAVVSVILIGVGLGLILIFTGLLKFPPEPSIAAFFFLVPGLACTLFALRSLWTVVASRSWPTVEASVVRSTVTRFRGDSMSGGNRFYQPSIAYQYEIDGVTYVGTRLDWGRFGTTREEAQRVADGYPFGQLVTAYYDPSRPHRSVIEPRGWTTSIFLLVFGLGFVVGGVLMVTVMR